MAAWRKMNTLTTEFKNEAEKIINNLRNDLTSIRTGRATPALVENIIVETYQGQAKLKLLELASITADAQSLNIIPYDMSTMKDIEKAILKSPLGMNPNTVGNKIILKLPPLTQEQRQKILKFVNQKIEEKKEQLRISRDNARKKMRALFDKKEITEDDKFRLEKEIDNLTQKYNETISDIKHKKEKEVIEI